MIATDRLILRPYEIGDLAPYLVMSNDPQVQRFPAGPPLSKEAAWRRINAYVQHWTLAGYGMFAVIEAATGQYVGETGLCDFDRGMGEDFDGFDEAAWHLGSSVQRLGYGIEAASAAHAWYDGRRGPRRTVCMIDPAHERSIRLAEKLGYRSLREAEYKSNPVLVFERRPVSAQQRCDPPRLRESSADRERKG